MSSQITPVWSDAPAHRGFCIYLDTYFQGPTLAVRDGEGMPCCFDTEAEAQREITEHMLMRLRHFMDGGGDFHDAIRIEEYVVPVHVLTDGSIVDKDGRHFGKCD